MKKRQKRCAILISGRGSNMVSLIESQKDTSPFQIVLVISNVPGAPGLAKAQSMGIQTCAVDHRLYDSREAFERSLSEKLVEMSIDLICLAGFMRILSSAFIHRWSGRILNIHPSLLPAFKGLDTHQRALDAGVNRHGCSVHFVTEELDSGALIIQAPVPVYATDTADTLAQRVLVEEHRIYPQALSWLADGSIMLKEGKIVTHSSLKEGIGIVKPAKSS